MGPDLSLTPSTFFPGHNGPLYTGYLAIPDNSRSGRFLPPNFPWVYTGFTEYRTGPLLKVYKQKTRPDRNLPRCRDYKTPVLIQMKLATTEKLIDMAGEILNQGENINRIPLNAAEV